MKIGLLSDTHSFLAPQVLTYFADCDEIWHAGDIGTVEVADTLAKFKPFRAVVGNIDGGMLRRMYPEDLRFVCEGVDIWITHIAGRPSRYTARVREGLNKKKPDIFICGHSHILCVKRDPRHGGMLYLNPGAAGHYGIHLVCTLLRFDLLAGKVKNLEVIEFKRR